MFTFPAVASVPCRCIYYQRTVVTVWLANFCERPRVVERIFPSVSSTSDTSARAFALVLVRSETAGVWHEALVLLIIHLWLLLISPCSVVSS